MTTRLQMKIGSAEAVSQYRLELEPATSGPAAGPDIGAASGEALGEIKCRLDSGSAQTASWARVGPGLYSILLGSRSYEVRVSRASGPSGGADYAVRVGTDLYQVSIEDRRFWRRQTAGGAEGPRDVNSPMPGRVVKLLVREGDEVAAGQGLLVMEAMKMQNELRAPRAGRVQRIFAAEGDGVETGAPLVRLVESFLLK